MGKFLLLLVAGAALSLGLTLGLSTLRQEAATDEAFYQSAHVAFARNVALSGLGDAEARISQAFAQQRAYAGPLAWTGSYDGEPYHVQVGSSEGLIAITARGEHVGAERHVHRTYSPRAREVPPFLRYALLSDHQLDLRDALTIVAPPPLEARVHANHHLRLRDPSSSIEGYASTSRMLFGPGGTLLDLLFDVDEPTGPLYQEGVPEVPVLEMNVADYERLATEVLGRRASVSGVLQGGTEAAPAVIYAPGGLSTSGEVEVDGWVVLAVDGTFDVDHSVRTRGTPEQSQLLVVVDHQIRVNAPSLEIAGTWHAGHMITLDADTRIVDGGISSGHTIRTLGPLTIEYRPLSLGLVGALWPDHLVPRSYREW